MDASRPERDLARQESRLRDKALTLLGPLVGAGEAAAVVERILRLDAEADVAAFMRSAPVAG